MNNKNNKETRTREEKRQRTAKAPGKGWKWAFIVLLVCNILAIGGLTALVLLPPKHALPAVSHTTQSGQKVGTFSTTTSELNGLINSYLSSHANAKTAYSFQMTSTGATLQTTSSFLGQSVPLTVNFLPTKTSDGNIDMQVTGVSAGSLNLPTSTVLSFLSDRGLPSIVTVDSTQDMLHINLSALTVANRFHLSCQTFDPASNSYVFTLYN